MPAELIKNIRKTDKEDYLRFSSDMASERARIRPFLTLRATFRTSAIKKLFL